jgi:predicted cytidylate kinase
MLPAFAIGAPMPKLIITISGLIGTGKTTLGDRIGEKLNIKHISRTHKVISGSRDVLEFAKKATPSFEKAFDKGIVDEAKEQDCVVTTWLSPWLIKDPSVRVWLYADLEARIKRKAAELKMTNAEAKKYVIERDSFNKANFKKLYGIDIEDRHNFDMLLNTSKLSIDQCADTIIFLSLEKEKKRFK